MLYVTRGVKNLTSQVLSMSKNKINALPTYIADMNDLKILKLDHNPITFPPKAVWEVEDSDGEMWLDGVKRFLRQHFEKLGNMQDTESGSRYAVFTACLHLLS